MRPILLFTLFLVLPFITSAQFDVKVAYEGEYRLFKSTNQALDQFNSSNEWLDPAYKNLHFLNGFNLGGRYMAANHVGLEVFYSNKWADRNAAGFDLSNAEYYGYLQWRDIQYGLGTEVFINSHLSLSADLAWNTIKIASRTSTNADKSVFSTEENWSSKLGLSYYVQAGNHTKVGVRPYLQFVWQESDRTDLQNYLNISGIAPASNKLRAIGISLVFYNGTTSLDN